MTRAFAVAGFALAGLLMVAVELAARREGSRVPALGDVCGYVMRYQVGRVPVGRIGILGFWWWLGWHFFAR
ncbi:DUF6186 family protein [Catenuloplanes sp. NPDC051500]|uniref:DUF6186 family protein n=1 Tax=Catenuloplanes sp. NPDC051500 TaxID=3363959 RepID=UPI0037B5669F